MSTKYEFQRGDYIQFQTASGEWEDGIYMEKHVRGPRTIDHSVQLLDVDNYYQFQKVRLHPSIPVDAARNVTNDASPFAFASVLAGLRSALSEIEYAVEMLERKAKPNG